MPLSDYVNRVQELLPTAQDELPAGTIDNCVQDAVARYSRIRPRLQVWDIVGDGNTYQWSLPSDWRDGFSTILAVELGSVGEQFPSYIDPLKWRLYLEPDGWKLRMFVTPSNGETVRVVYTVPHVVDATTDTVYPEDFEAVCYLAASRTALALAGKYSGYYEPSFQADVINYRTKAADYRGQARVFERLFQLHFGMDEDSAAPAALGWLDIDLPTATDSLAALPVAPIAHTR